MPLPQEQGHTLSLAFIRRIEDALQWQRNFRVIGARLFRNTPTGCSLDVTPIANGSTVQPSDNKFGVVCRIMQFGGGAPGVYTAQLGRDLKIKVSNGLSGTFGIFGSSGGVIDDSGSPQPDALFFNIEEEGRTDGGHDLQAGQRVYGVLVPGTTSLDDGSGSSSSSSSSPPLLQVVGGRLNFACQPARSSSGSGG